MRCDGGFESVAFFVKTARFPEPNDLNSPEWEATRPLANAGFDGGISHIDKVADEPDEDFSRTLNKLGVVGEPSVQWVR